MLRFCREAHLAHDFVDNRRELPTIQFSFNAALRKHQTTAVGAVRKKDFGVIVAPPGTGKTVIGLKIISVKQQPALIVVHRKQLLDQWVERIESFLGIPKADIGIIGQGKVKLGTGKNNRCNDTKSSKTYRNYSGQIWHNSNRRMPSCSGGILPCYRRKTEQCLLLQSHSDSFSEI
ncbi:Type III restriction enzyme, res subunit [Sphingobacterium daejeonense]|nr:Type III restriction enzyme, res subunit [Sphingobacterium daejeonense]